MGYGQQWHAADGSPSRSWMQWMHRGAQHARAATVALMMAAEALCTQGGCTLVHRMQWQCGGCCCSWMARTCTISCLQVAKPHDFAQQPATATVLRRCGLQRHCATSNSVNWCCARRWALASNRRLQVARPRDHGCSGCIVVLSMLALRLWRWWQGLRHSILEVAAPSCSDCSGNAMAAAARGWLARAPARA